MAETNTNFTVGANPEIKVYMNERLRRHNTYSNAISALVMAGNLDGVRGPIIALPDLTFSYGLPIGGVLATDAQAGDISLNAIGNDMGCGISLSSTGVSSGFFLTDKGLNIKLCRKITRAIQARLSQEEKFNLEEIFKLGIPGLGGLASGRIEDYGHLPVRKNTPIEEELFTIGSRQLGTLGGGNHFVDLLECAEVYDPLAKSWGINPGEVLQMVHSGSRGVGSFVKNKYSKTCAGYSREGIFQPRKFQSSEGQDILNLVNLAGNFAYANREVLRRKINRVLEDIFGLFFEPNLIYDSNHNSISLEREGNNELLVHRKGATKAYPALHPQLTAEYLQTGNPIILPGSLGTPTYVLVPTDKIAETRNSISHGAGRKYSRGFVESKKKRPCFSTPPENVFINLRLRDYRAEIPAAYKDIDQIVKTLEENGLVRKVAKLNPFFAYLERGE